MDLTGQVRQLLSKWIGKYGAPQSDATLTLGGVFDYQLKRDGKIIDEWQSKNIVVDEGLDATLDIMFHASTQITTWYIGIFEGNYTPLATDTAANITANSTESTAYDESVRQTYVEAAASSQSITNSANKATFTINDTKTIYGAFLVSDSTKSGTSGTLAAASKFSSSRSVVDDDELLITYTLSISSS